MAKRSRIVQSQNESLNIPIEVSEAISEIGGLKKLSSAMPSDADIVSLAKFHLMLSDETRLKILWAVNYCDLCPCVLIEFLKISNSRLSYHLAELEAAGLVESYPKKNWKIYSITKVGKNALTCCLNSSNRSSIGKT